MRIIGVPIVQSGFSIFWCIVWGVSVSFLVSQARIGDPGTIMIMMMMMMMRRMMMMMMMILVVVLVLVVVVVVIDEQRSSLSGMIVDK